MDLIMFVLHSPLYAAASWWPGLSPVSQTPAPAPAWRGSGRWGASGASRQQAAACQSRRLTPTRRLWMSEPPRRHHHPDPRLHSRPSTAGSTASWLSSARFISEPWSPPACRPWRMSRLKTSQRNRGDIFSVQSGTLIYTNLFLRGVWVGLDSKANGSCRLSSVDRPPNLPDVFLS